MVPSNRMDLLNGKDYSIFQSKLALKSMFEFHWRLIYIVHIPFFQDTNRDLYIDGN